MDNTTDDTRINVRIPVDIQNFYKAEAKKYSLPYTNYISYLLSQFAEKAKEKEMVNRFNDSIDSLRQMSDDSKNDELISLIEELIKLSK